MARSSGACRGSAILPIARAAASRRSCEGSSVRAASAANASGVAIASSATRARPWTSSEGSSNDAISGDAARGSGMRPGTNANFARKSPLASPSASINSGTAGGPIRISASMAGWNDLQWSTERSSSARATCFFSAVSLATKPRPISSAASCQLLCTRNSSARELMPLHATAIASHCRTLARHHRSKVSTSASANASAAKYIPINACWNRTKLPFCTRRLASTAARNSSSPSRAATCMTGTSSDPEPSTNASASEASAGTPLWVREERRRERCRLPSGAEWTRALRRCRLVIGQPPRCARSTRSQIRQFASRYLLSGSEPFLEQVLPTQIPLQALAQASRKGPRG